MSYTTPPKKRELTQEMGVIYMALDVVTKFMAKWLDDNLKTLSPDYWDRYVVSSLYESQQKTVRDNGAKSLYDLDQSTILSVFLQNKAVLLREFKVDPQLFGYAQSIKDIRNKYFHKNAKPLSERRFNHDLETIALFLEGMGAPPKIVAEARGDLQRTVIDIDSTKSSVSQMDVSAKGDVKIFVSPVNNVTSTEEGMCVVKLTPRSMQLPKWIDDKIYGELNAIYCPCCRDMTVIDWSRAEIKKYLGTYFPRSYVEAFCLYSDYFKAHLEEYKDRKNLSVFDFGCGTGGEIFGFLDAVEQNLPSVEVVKVRALDGNHHALRALERIIDHRKAIGELTVNLKTMPVTIDDFYDLGVARSVVDDTFDFFMTCKAVCEFVTKQQFEENNPYANIIQVFSDILVPDGKMLITDVSTKNGTSKEWLPKMLDVGIKESGATILARNGGFNESFVVKHSHAACDQSKIAWCFIEPAKGDKV